MVEGRKIRFPASLNMNFKSRQVTLNLLHFDMTVNFRPYLASHTTGYLESSHRAHIAHALQVWRGFLRSAHNEGHFIRIMYDRLLCHWRDLHYTSHR